MMKVQQTAFEGLYIIQPSVFEDKRGYFFESWNQRKFRDQRLDFDFVQDNQSLSAANVLRGLHFQVPPWEQGKLVQVIRGSALDVVVDLRKGQPTFGKNFKLVISAREKNMLWIPPGFAHGFLTLEDNTLFFYKCTQLYNKESERAILWNDPMLDIDWGIENPVVSDKDNAAMMFSDFISPF